MSEQRTNEAVPGRCSPSLPKDIATGRRQEVLNRLCNMMDQAWKAIDPDANEPCDCACTDRGLAYQNSGAALDFMQSALAAAINGLHRTANPIPDSARSTVIEECAAKLLSEGRRSANNWDAVLAQKGAAILRSMKTSGTEAAVDLAAAAGGNHEPARGPDEAGTSSDNEGDPVEWVDGVGLVLRMLKTNKEADRILDELDAERPKRALRSIGEPGRYEVTTESCGPTTRHVLVNGQLVVRWMLDKNAETVASNLRAALATPRTETAEIVRQSCGHDLQDRSTNHCLMCQQLGEVARGDRIRREAIETCAQVATEAIVANRSQQIPDRIRALLGKGGAR